MEKEIISTKKQIKDVLDNYGIKAPIFAIAKKMDLNLVKLFYDKIITNYSKSSLDEVTKNLLGVYGNYLATYYYSSLKYNVKNEVPVYDSLGKEITRADVSFIDNDGVLNYCEVKATSQIIDNIRNYVDNDNAEDKGYVDKDNEIIKYKQIGKKLINQVKKLSSTGAKVNVVIFSGCIMDNIIKNELSHLGANVLTLAIDVNELEKQIKDMVISIRRYFVYNASVQVVVSSKKERRMFK